MTWWRWNISLEWQPYLWRARHLLRAITLIIHKSTDRHNSDAGGKLQQTEANDKSYVTYHFSSLIFQTKVSFIYLFCFQPKNTLITCKFQTQSKEGDRAVALKKLSLQVCSVTQWLSDIYWLISKFEITRRKKKEENHQRREIDRQIYVWEYRNTQMENKLKDWVRNITLNDSVVVKCIVVWVLLIPPEISTLHNLVA